MTLEQKENFSIILAFIITTFGLWYFTNWEVVIVMAGPVFLLPIFVWLFLSLYPCRPSNALPDKEVVSSILFIGMAAMTLCVTIIGILFFVIYIIKLLVG